MGIDVLGTDILGIDILGIDILAPTPVTTGLVNMHSDRSIANLARFVQSI